MSKPSTTPDAAAKSVLIVDDEPMARTILHLMMVQAGYHVSEAEDGYDALEKIRINPPDIMLLDVMMPGMDGFTVCESVRNNDQTSQLPIIFLSAKTNLESINKGFLVGGTEYLMKPISPEELVRHVQYVLHNVELGVYDDD